LILILYTLFIYLSIASKKIKISKYGVIFGPLPQIEKTFAIILSFFFIEKTEGIW